MGKKRTTVPKQRRSIETRQKIKDTAHSLFSSKGFHGTTSNEIASVAGVNIGTFYNYFEDKKVLLLELLEDFQARFFDMAFSDEVPDTGETSIRDFTRFYLERSFDAFRRDREFFKSVYPLQYMDKDVEKVFRKYEQKEARQVLAVYLQKFGDIDAKEAKNRVSVIAVIAASVSNRFYTLGLPIGRKQLINALTEMISGYLEVLESQGSKGSSINKSK